MIKDKNIQGDTTLIEFLIYPVILIVIIFSFYTLFSTNEEVQRLKKIQESVESFELQAKKGDVFNIVLNEKTRGTNIDFCSMLMINESKKFSSIKIGDIQSKDIDLKTLLNECRNQGDKDLVRLEFTK